MKQIYLNLIVSFVFSRSSSSLKSLVETSQLATFEILRKALAALGKIESIMHIAIIVIAIIEIYWMRKIGCQH